MYKSDTYTADAYAVAPATPAKAHLLAMAADAQSSAGVVTIA